MHFGILSRAHDAAASTRRMGAVRDRKLTLALTQPIEATEVILPGRNLDIVKSN
jgi:hypothetical protein